LDYELLAGYLWAADLWLDYPGGGFRMRYWDRYGVEVGERLYPQKTKRQSFGRRGNWELPGAYMPPISVGGSAIWMLIPEGGMSFGRCMYICQILNQIPQGPCKALCGKLMDGGCDRLFWTCLFWTCMNARNDNFAKFCMMLYDAICLGE